MQKVKGLSLWLRLSDHGRYQRGLVVAILVISLAGMSWRAQADAWVAVGDRGLRSDLELLAAHGLVPNLLSTWPIPDGALVALRDPGLLDLQAAEVRAAAQHVIAARLSDQPRALTPLASVRTTNEPALVRDFGAAARQPLDANTGFDWTGEQVSLTVRAGVQTHYDGDDGRPALDGTELTVLLGNIQLYGGWVEQWYGPGWMSALSLSNNARPFPKIGLMRNNPHAFESKWLRWLGPWQINTYAGLLDGPRIDKDTLNLGLRLSFNPLKGLEIGLTRLTEMCGQNHPCQPLAGLFDLRNDPSKTNKVNDEANIDARYVWLVNQSLIITPYFQLMNEDTGPFTHSYTSHLLGASISGALGTGGGRWRVISEYADTVPTLNVFSYGKYSTGLAYNNAGYPDGYRYRDQTLGFSLDSDSRLLSVAGVVTDARGWNWRATAHFAGVSSSELQAEQGAGHYNSLTTQPQHVAIGELGLNVPWRRLSIDVALRAQNHPLEPVQSSRYAGEFGLTYRY